MGMFDWVAFEKGQAHFCGSQRRSDAGGQYIFAVQLPHWELPMYGEFKTTPASRMSHNVEILNFGYRNNRQVGKPPLWRQTFTPSEAEDIRGIIRELMLADVEKPFPLHKPERFEGEVFFKDGWINRS